MLRGCPNCGSIYETSAENANEPSWCNPRARRCPRCLGLPEERGWPPRLSEHEMRLREHHENEEMERQHPDPFGGFRPRPIHLPDEQQVAARRARRAAP
jgi:hypothetical protein